MMRKCIPALIFSRFNVWNRIIESENVVPEAELDRKSQDYGSSFWILGIANCSPELDQTLNVDACLILNQPFVLWQLGTF